MHLQRLAPDQSVQQVALFILQRIAPFARTQTTTDRQTSILAERDRHVLGVLREALSSSAVSSYSASSRNPCLENCGAGQGLCVGLDRSLLEVVGVGLITCEGVGLVRQVHTLFSGSAQARYGPQGSGRSVGRKCRR